MANITNLTDEEIGPETARIRNAYRERDAAADETAEAETIADEETIEIDVEVEPSIIDERRLGNFRLGDDLLRVMSTENLLKLFSNFVIVRCEHRFDFKGFEYIAYSPLFEPVAPNCMYSNYQINSDSDGNIIAIKW